MDGADDGGDGLLHAGKGREGHRVRTGLELSQRGGKGWGLAWGSWDGGRTRVGFNSPWAMHLEKVWTLSLGSLRKKWD